ncbi:MAG: hypothetical protein II183_01455, partial [Elusimicrobiaceae bacterium]|nr:hypothetical protein [Elusimicrobiaceae bacterium]
GMHLIGVEDPRAQSRHAQYDLRGGTAVFYISNRNQAEFALQDALEDNKNNLYAFIEKLPENTRNTAFNYIAENYYDDFQNQTDNLLYALAVLEKSSLNTTHKNQKNIEQKINTQLDKTYKNTEKKIKQDALNM